MLQAVFGYCYFGIAYRNKNKTIRFKKLEVANHAIYKQLFMALGFHGTSTTFVILIQDTYDGESLYCAWLC